MDNIKKQKNISLSSDDIYDALDGKIRIIDYSYLAKVNHIDEILEPYDACVILYMTRKNYGHWTCVFKRGNLIEHFDSYGLMVDDELNFDMDPYFRKISNQDYPHLSFLLYNSNYDLSFNEHQFQKKLKNIQTCGRHVIVRLWFRHLPLEEYKSFFDNQKYDPDTIVTFLTKKNIN